MEFFDLILSGFGFGAVKSLLLLLLRPEDFITDEYVAEKVKGYLKSNEQLKDKEQVKSYVTLVFNDRFTPLTNSKPQTQTLIKKLDILRKKMLDLYFSTLEELAGTDNDLKRVCDVDITLNNYVLQLMRLRSVIQPQISISKSIHPKTNIAYLAAKSYWKNDNNIQERKFTKSIGRADAFPGGIKDTKAIEEGFKLIQETMLNVYVDLYPD